jgi:hypothetical protein
MFSRGFLQLCVREWNEGCSFILLQVLQHLLLVVGGGGGAFFNTYRAYSLTQGVSHGRGAEIPFRRLPHGD